MGRMLGAFDNDEPLDRPDLNKCPDCGCYFATDECPLCGKTCPPEMRAGARVEPKKKKKSSGNSGGRVTFIPWYHSWWFILLMLFFMPLAGIILFITSPYSRKWKIIISSIAAVYLVLVASGLGSYLISRAVSGPMVNKKISREAYVERCLEVDAEDYYRTLSRKEKEYYSMTLVVRECGTDTSSPWIFGMYNRRSVYVCYAPDDPSVVILVRDCQVKDGMVFKTGDRIKVYGQATGVADAYGEGDRWLDNLPCLNMAYADLLKE